MQNATEPLIEIEKTTMKLTPPLCAFLLMTFFLLVSPYATAAEWVQLGTRPNVTVQMYWMENPKATATVILFAGGDGVIGNSEAPEPTSKNFVVRSRNLFRAAGLNVLVLGMPSDKRDQDVIFRGSDEHMMDIRRTVEFVRSKSGVPVWLVATSLGTISAAQAAVTQGKALGLAGIVLTSTFTSWKHTNSVPKLALNKVTIPVHIYHHADDQCQLCKPRDTEYVYDHLTNASIKKRVLVSGGENPVGDPCMAMHNHGFRGMERQAVSDIAA